MRGSFLRGLLDGALSTLGVVIGAYAAAPSVIIAAAVGGTIANGISNTLSAFSAAGSEQYRQLRSVEKAMVSRQLKESILDQRIGRRTMLAGAVDGVATMIGGALPTIPYVFLPRLQAMGLSIGLVVLTAAVAGVYLGRLSRRNLLLSALKMAIFAVVVAAVVYLVQLLIVE